MNRNSTPFLDLLFNLLMGFAFLFFISFLLIQPKAKKADAKNNAEYVIQMVWPNGNLDDIDLWVEAPDATIVWFRDKEGSMAHLDRDDLGMVHDVITLANGEIVTNPRNQEIVTIRGFLAGEWVINAHAYKKRDQKPTPVTITIDRVNPTFKTLFMKQIVMENAWQEETFTRFEMLSSGAIISWSDLPKKLVKAETVYSGYGHDEDR